MWWTREGSPFFCNVFFVKQIKYLRMKSTSLVSKSRGRGESSNFSLTVASLTAWITIYSLHKKQTFIIHNYSSQASNRTSTNRSWLYCAFNIIFVVVIYVNCSFLSFFLLQNLISYQLVGLERRSKLLKNNLHILEHKRLTIDNLH